MKKKELPEVEPVKIKPLFGLKPGVWLTIAYALAIILIIFFLGILPGIKDGFKRVTFRSDIGNCAVYVDGKYKGGTPFTTKIPSGLHDVSYQVNGVEIDNFKLSIGHPFFFTWLFPRHEDVYSYAQINVEAFNALSKELLEDAVAYSAVLDYDDTHRYAPIFTTYAKALASSQFKSDTSALFAALSFVTTQEMYDDASNALSILGLKASIPFSSLDGKASVGVQDELPIQGKAVAERLKTDLVVIDGFRISQSTFSNGRSVTASYPEVNEAGNTVTVPSFCISAICVTENMYANFVAQNPQWALSNKDNLIAQGLVDEYYLDGVTLSLSVSSSRPVRNVSYYAAKAFCKWLSELSGKEIFLPTEDQWIAAALCDTDGGYQKSLMPTIESSYPSAMLGSVWEMTSTPYIPMARIQDNNATEAFERFSVDCDVVIKGGSYVNSPSEIDVYSVGVAYPSLCNDFMGFRIAWN